MPWKNSETKHLITWYSCWVTFRKTISWSWYLVLNVSHSVMSDSVTPWTVAHQAPLSMGFSRQEYWHELPFSSPGDLSNLGIEPRSPTLQAAQWPLIQHVFGPEGCSIYLQMQGRSQSEPPPPLFTTPFSLWILGRQGISPAQLGRPNTGPQPCHFA